jgi:hypothetical protein
VKSERHQRIVEVLERRTVLTRTPDDAMDEELAQAPVTYEDGRNDRWDQAPAETRYL